MNSKFAWIISQIFVITTICTLTNAQGSWSEPPFTDPQTTGIQFVPLSDYLAIRMDEEIPVPFRLAIINYNGDEQPVFRDFTIGSPSNLNLSISREGNRWNLFVTRRQDYENPAQTRYEFAIGIEGEVLNHIISIVTQNIFDNNPSITYDGPCLAPELHKDFNTECYFKIYDPDGLRQNEFRLEIEGSNEEESLFDFRNQRVIDEYNVEYTLFVIAELRYEQRVLYNFKTFVYDVVGNPGNITTIVEITDEPSLPPVWTTPFATARFLEKTPQKFLVAAIDGDTGINRPICYRLDFENEESYADLISIGEETGAIDVQPIDRDAMKREDFPFKIIAYKCYNETWAIESSAVLIVDDVNDNWPEITISPKIIEILEATYLTLPLDEFIINDIDLARHASYNVELSNGDDPPVQFASAFTVIPDKGYQESNFRLTVADAIPLDYENDTWREFTFTIIATEEDFPDRFRQMDLQVKLINWNDEMPIFELSEYVVEVNETIEGNINLIRVHALDRDYNDAVIHTIIGVTDLHITDDGDISTINNDTFDFERQTSVLVQIQATDTLQTDLNERLHSVYTQLTINVLDINDETPDLRMPRTAPKLMENSEHGTVVTTEIYATDPDTTADLVFTIDWTESYATKAGREADKTTYVNCFIIERDVANKSRVYGHLKVNPDFDGEIDYEMYEVIYLQITVEDLNQAINEGKTGAILTIQIEDENDNSPEFILDTLNTERSVIEEALSGTLIGTIFATDVDGPPFNNISYFISPTESTPPDWVEINLLNGAITVKENALIDCDDPLIFDLTYTVILSDGKFETRGNITISIIDINNKIPQFGEFKKIIELYENVTTGEFIEMINATDLDRDVPHNVVQYMLNYAQFPNLLNYFEIDELTGVLSVRLLGDAKMDRDRGDPEHYIHINIQDNYLGSGRPNENKAELTLILKDVNNNAPQLPSPNELSFRVNEEAEVGTRIGTTIYAPDIDDPATPNSMVSYEITSIIPDRDHSSTIPDQPEEVFQIINNGNKYADLVVKSPLKGFYGTWLIRIRAYDHGDEWDSNISLDDEQVYELTVEPYNYNAPTMEIPVSNSVFRIDFGKQVVGGVLMLTDETTLPLFEASDPDGGVYGHVQFEIANFVPDSNNAEYFELVQIPNNYKQTQLRLRRYAEEKTYQINIRATDGGGRTSEWSTNIMIVFVNMTGEPIFDPNAMDTNFTENEDGLIEKRTINEAEDPKNAGISNEQSKFPIYYFIDATYRPYDAVLFKLNSTTRILELESTLDREMVPHHEIRVIASNRQVVPSFPMSNSMLTVRIAVNDVNDNPPTFERRNYGTGITPNDYTGKAILTVRATDPDLDDVIRYVIVKESLNETGENLENVLSTAFTLDERSGVISLNFVVSPTMKGFFQFKVRAYDFVDHTDECDIKIYIIAESNRVTFVLMNPRSMVESQSNYLTQTFTEFYKYECNIDDILPAEVEGVSQETITNVRAHFIHDNEPIEASEIISKSNDILFITNLKAALIDQQLNLLDVPNKNDVDDGPNLELILQILLITLSAILACLCLALFITYMVKTRGLKRQLKALSATDFGSTASNLNRREAPTTNVFSVEGSNPVLNHNDLGKNAFDNISMQSDDSDDSEFVGINNDPIFNKPNERKDSTNVAVVSNLYKRNGVNGIPKSQQNGTRPADQNNFKGNSNESSDFGTYKF